MGPAAKTLERIAQVEEDFGLPFHQVLMGFATDGESMRSTASILDIPHKTFYRLAAARDPSIPWAVKNDTNSWKACDRKSPAIRAAALRNLEKARAARWP